MLILSFAIAIALIIVVVSVLALAGEIAERTSKTLMAEVVWFLTLMTFIILPIIGAIGLASGYLPR